MSKLVSTDSLHKTVGPERLKLISLLAACREQRVRHETKNSLRVRRNQELKKLDEMIQRRRSMMERWRHG